MDTLTQWAAGWTAPTAASAQLPVLGDVWGMRKMLFHNELFSVTAGQVNLRESRVCVAAPMIRPLQCEPGPSAVCVSVCAKVVDLAWWSGFKPAEIRSVNSWGRGGKTGEVLTPNPPHVFKSVLTASWPQKMKLTIIKLCLKHFNHPDINTDNISLFAPYVKIIAGGLLHNGLIDSDSSELFWWRRNTIKASSSHLPASVTSFICSHGGNPQDEPASVCEAVMSSLFRSQQLWVSGISLQGQRQRVWYYCVLSLLL